MPFEFPFILIGKLTTAFSTDQSWRVLKSWYTGRDQEQGFQRCFAMGFNQNLASFVALANGTPAHNDLGLLSIVVFYMQLDGVSSAGAMERGWVWLWQNNSKKYNSYNLSVFRGCYMKNRLRLPILVTLPLSTHWN